MGHIRSRRMRSFHPHLLSSHGPVQDHFQQRHILTHQRLLLETKSNKMTARITIYLGLTILMTSCANERTSFTNGRQIQWEAKHSNERAAAMSAPIDERESQAEAVGATEVATSPDLNGTAEHRSESTTHPSETYPEASASLTPIMTLEDKSVVERLSDSQPLSTSPSSSSEGTEKDTNTEKTNGMAIAGFVTSLFFPVIGLVLSAIALGQIKRNGGKGKGLATAGLVIGIIFTLLLLALL